MNNFLRLTFAGTTGLILVLFSSNTVAKAKPFRISGLVLNKGGDVISGVKVILQDGDTKIDSSITSPNGEYELEYTKRAVVTIVFSYVKYCPGKVRALSGAKNHTINKVLYRQDELWELSLGEREEIQATLSFMKNYPGLYSEELVYYKDLDTQIPVEMRPNRLTYARIVSYGVQTSALQQNEYQFTYPLTLNFGIPQPFSNHSYIPNPFSISKEVPFRRPVYGLSAFYSQGSYGDADMFALRPERRPIFGQTSNDVSSITSTQWEANYVGRPAVYSGFEFVTDSFILANGFGPIFERSFWQRDASTYTPNQALRYGVSRNFVEENYSQAVKNSDLNRLDKRMEALENQNKDFLAQIDEMTQSLKLARHNESETRQTIDSMIAKITVLLEKLNTTDHNQGIPELIIKFNEKSHELTPAVKIELDKFAKRVYQLTAYFISVEGFADSKEHSKAQSLLIKRRLDAISLYLIVNGVHVENIRKTVNYDRPRPLKGNQPEDSPNIDRVMVNLFVPQRNLVEAIESTVPKN